MKYQVIVADVLSILQRSSAQGLSIETLLKDIVLPSDLLADPQAMITMDNCWNIIAAHQNIIQDETHLLSSRPLMRGTTKHIFSNLTHCADLLEGLEMIAETYNVVHGGDYNSVRHRATGLSFVVNDQDFHYRDSGNHFAIEFALLRIHCVLTYIVGRPLAIKKVSTKREPIEREHHHLEIFECPIDYNCQTYELTYHSQEQTAGFRAVDNIDLSAHLWNNYLGLIATGQASDFDGKLADAVVDVLRKGVLEQAAVAQALRVSPATLRRKLKQQRTTFREISDRVNRELAANDLLDRVPVEDVAEKFGYSDLRSFKRAFVRWHGVSPAVFLKEHGIKK